MGPRTQTSETVSSWIPHQHSLTTQGMPRSLVGRWSVTLSLNLLFECPKFPKEATNCGMTRRRGRRRAHVRLCCASTTSVYREGGSGSVALHSLCPSSGWMCECILPCLLSCSHVAVVSVLAMMLGTPASLNMELDVNTSSHTQNTHRVNRCMYHEAFSIRPLPL